MAPRPIAIASGCLLALALFAVPGWIACHRRDAAAPDDRDLRLALASATISENGFDRFSDAARAARLPTDEPTWRRFHAFRQGETWEPEWISQLVAQNTAATGLLRAGLATPAFVLPPTDGAEAQRERLSTLFRVQQLIALAGAHARILLREGRAREAIELDSLGLHAGRRMSAAANLDLFGIYMATAFQTVSLLDLEHAARTARLSPGAAREVAQVLESTRWTGEDWRRVWGLEYEHLLGEAAAVSERSGEWSLSGWPLFLLPGAYRWQPHRTATALADVYRDQVAKSARSCSRAELPGAAPLAPRVGVALLLAPNAIGQLAIAEAHARQFDRVQLQRCQLETEVSLVEVLVAAKAYFDTEGALPERLEDLVPRYLDAVPLDRYDGAPLRYARGARAVYSVGEDFADADGGSAPSLVDPREPGLSLAF